MYFYQMLDVLAMQVHKEMTDDAARWHVVDKETAALVKYWYKHRPEFAKWLLEDAGSEDQFTQGFIAGLADVLALCNKHGLPDDLAEALGTLTGEDNL